MIAKGNSGIAAPGHRDNSIGLLRMLLAAMVVYDHSWYLGDLGQDPISRTLLNDATTLSSIAVHGFFALSGYLILQSEQRTASTRAFLVNRGLRIFPGLWFCLLLSALVLPALAWWNHAPEAKNWSGAFSYFWQNLLQPRSQVGVPGLFPEVPRPGDLNGSLWTLPYEIGCYAVLATIGWGGFTRKASVLPWITGGLILGLYFFDVSFPTHAWFFKTAGRNLAASFVCGAMFALVPEPTLKTWLRGGWALLAAGAFGLAAHLGGLPLVSPVAIAVMIVWLAWHLPGKNFERQVRGDYSYGLYIYAYPVQQALAYVAVPHYGFLPYFLLSLLLSLPLAVVSWHLVEAHALRFKLRRPAAVPATSSAPALP